MRSVANIRLDQRHGSWSLVADHPDAASPVELSLQRRSGTSCGPADDVNWRMMADLNSRRLSDRLAGSPTSRT
jgi:hypothetical protein